MFFCVNFLNLFVKGIFDFLPEMSIFITIHKTDVPPSFWSANIRFLIEKVDNVENPGYNSLFSALSPRIFCG